jgi:thiamine biosynthesis lipoprotein ApbE
MSESSNISLPTWSLPLVFALGSGLVVYGSTEARAEATAQEVLKIEAAVKKQADKINSNSELSKVNQAQIVSVVDALKTNSDALAKTDASLNLLIQTMLKNQQ